MYRMKKAILCAHGQKFTSEWVLGYCSLSNVISSKGYEVILRIPPVSLTGLDLTEWLRGENGKFGLSNEDPFPDCVIVVDQSVIPNQSSMEKMLESVLQNPGSVISATHSSQSGSGISAVDISQTLDEEKGLVPIAAKDITGNDLIRVKLSGMGFFCISGEALENFQKRDDIMASYKIGKFPLDILTTISNFYVNKEVSVFIHPKAVVPRYVKTVSTPVSL